MCALVDYVDAELGREGKYVLIRGVTARNVLRQQT